MFETLLTHPILANTVNAVAQENSFFYAFDQSDWMGKAVVLVLVFGSVLTWMIMVEKFLMLRKAMQFSQRFNKLFGRKTYPIQSMRDAKDLPSPLVAVYEAGAQQLLVFYEMDERQSEFYGTSNCPLKTLSMEEIEAVRTAMSNKVSDQIHIIEDKIPVLGTMVSLAPFLGLFGTVWGIMVAFCSLAQLGKASMAALAPGVSGALLTTVVGLLVAIPSLIGYNMMIQNIRKLTVMMDNFVEEFIAKVKLEQFSINEHNQD